MPGPTTPRQFNCSIGLFREGNIRQCRNDVLGDIAHGQKAGTGSTLRGVWIAPESARNANSRFQGMNRSLTRSGEA
jgi:hypothetical protein